MRESSQITDRAAETWAHLTGLYGENLVRAFGRSVPEPWRLAIRQLTTPQLERGLLELLSTGGAHPPTLPQFMAACRKAPLASQEPWAAPLLPAEFDEFHRLGCVQLLRFLNTNAVPNSMIPALVARKNEITRASRNDPELRPLKQADQAKELAPIYQGAFQRVFLDHAEAA